MCVYNVYVANVRITCKSLRAAWSHNLLIMKSLAYFLLQCSIVQHAAAASQASTFLWYPSPAATDFYAALPIGNGRLGAMVHGYTDKELIRLNEDSIWSGGPQFRANPEAPSHLDQIRAQINNGSLTDASNNWVDNFAGQPTNERAYLPAGEIRLDFAHPINSTTKYNRTLDVSTGISTVSYAYDGVTYLREAIANKPTDVLAFRLSASEANSLTFNIGLTRDQNVTALTADAKAKTITLNGISRDDNYYHFVSQLLLIMDGGT